MDKKSKKCYTAFDLFAGIGSMSLAAQMAGFEIEGAFDCYEKTGTAYMLNFNNNIHICKEFDSQVCANIPAVDILIGRLPCSVFRTTQSRNSSSVLNESSWKTLADIILEKRPRVFLFAMPHKMGQGEEWLRIFYEFLDDSYHISAECLDSCQITGLPVSDRKIYIAGIRNDLKEKFIFPLLKRKEHEEIRILLENNVPKKYFAYAEKYLNLDMHCGADVFCWSVDQYKPKEKLIYNAWKPPLVATELGIRKITNREMARTKCIPDAFCLLEPESMWLYRRLCDCVNVKVTAAILDQVCSFLYELDNNRNEALGISTKVKTALLLRGLFKEDKLNLAEKTIESPKDTEIEVKERPVSGSKEEAWPREEIVPDTEDGWKQKIKRMFLSYCQKDKDIADLIEERLTPLIKDEFKISRDIRDVAYKDSFRSFMESIREHEYVIMLISDRYIKSVNCMHEVTEVLKDSRFKETLSFIIPTEDDKKYYKTKITDKVGADIYNITDQGDYIIFWNREKDRLKKKVDEIGNPEDAIPQLNRMRQIERIKLDLNDFFQYLCDAKGLSLHEHLESGFSAIIKILKSGSNQNGV